MYLLVKPVAPVQQCCQLKSQRPNLSWNLISAACVFSMKKMNICSREREGERERERGEGRISKVMTYKCAIEFKFFPNYVITAKSIFQ